MFDDIDQILPEELSIDARLPDNALAARAGIAPSTCLGRIRGLRDNGVVRGFHADRSRAGARYCLAEVGDELTLLHGGLVKVARVGVGQRR